MLDLLRLFRVVNEMIFVVIGALLLVGGVRRALIFSIRGSRPG